MNQRNYQKELDRLIEQKESGGDVPRLFLHSCCAPCSSYVLEYLSQYFSITVFYYNPNIFPEEEYEKRVEEQRRLIGELPAKHPVHLLVGDYQPQRFFDAVRGWEKEPEGGERCFRCYRLRLGEAARLAAEGGYDYFTTTLTISPLKNARKLNEIGEEAEKERLAAEQAEKERLQAFCGAFRPLWTVSPELLRMCFFTRRFWRK